MAFRQFSNNGFYKNQKLFDELVGRVRRDVPNSLAFLAEWQTKINKDNNFFYDSYFGARVDEFYTDCSRFISDMKDHGQDITARIKKEIELTVRIILLELEASRIIRIEDKAISIAMLKQADKYRKIMDDKSQLIDLTSAGEVRDSLLLQIKTLEFNECDKLCREFSQQVEALKAREPGEIHRNFYCQLDQLRSLVQQMKPDATISRDALKKRIQLFKYLYTVLSNPENEQAIIYLEKCYESYPKDAISTLINNIVLNVERDKFVVNRDRFSEYLDPKNWYSDDWDPRFIAPLVDETIQKLEHVISRLSSFIQQTDGTMNRQLISGFTSKLIKFRDVMAGSTDIDYKGLKKYIKEFKSIAGEKVLAAEVQYLHLCRVCTTYSINLIKRCNELNERLNKIDEKTCSAKQKKLKLAGNEIVQQILTKLPMFKPAGIEPISMNQFFLSIGEHLMIKTHELLTCCITAIDEPQNKENFTKLMELSQALPGKAGPNLHLAEALLTFTAIALVIGGILAAIPSGGTSLLLSVGITNVCLASGLLGVTGGIGYSLFQENKKQGFALAASDFEANAEQVSGIRV